jgi:spermidine synthase
MLILGMGSGTFATQCERYFDGVNVEGVEIDNKITDLAREYFELPKDVKVTTYDGRAYLAATDKKYDVIMVDAYQDITIPFQMSTVEFFTMVKERLTGNGVMVVNMNMRGDKKGSINEYLSDTISKVFENVYIIDVDGSTNRELYAFESKEALETFKKNIELTKDYELRNIAKDIEEKMS